MVLLPPFLYGTLEDILPMILVKITMILVMFTVIIVTHIINQMLDLDFSHATTTMILCCIIFMYTSL